MPSKPGDSPEAGKAPIDLAQTADFDLGPVRVRPATREIVGSQGRTQIEPRVMEVLVALVQAKGEAVTRDQLVESCWAGRIVSDDAINRVISKLRGLSEGPALGAFAIETIPKLGYRLTAAAAAPTSLPPSTPTDAPAAKPISRRLVWGGVAAGVAAAGLGAWLISRPRTPTSAPPPDASSHARQLYDQALATFGHGEPGADARAVAFLREAVAEAPDWADAWAVLALAYSASLDTNPASEQAALAASAEAAARRALAIDPANADARGALALLAPAHGDWLRIETEYRAVLAASPKRAPMHRALASLLLSVGRSEAAIAEGEQARADEPFSPVASFTRDRALWHAGRLEEAERAMSQTAQLWPLTTFSFFPLVYLYLYGGRPKRALELLTDEQARPRGIPASDYELGALVARALISGSAADRAAALQANRAAAPRGAGYALNAQSFACALGDVDMAFDIANALNFGKPFQIAGQDFSTEQGFFVLARSRASDYLFGPATAAMRADPRFGKLVEQIGLADYWRKSGQKPDFCSAGCAWFKV